MARKKESVSTNKEKKSPTKKRKTKASLLKSISTSATILSIDEIKLLYSEIARGNIKEFTGLPPSIDTRLKAMEKLSAIIDKEKEEENENTTPTEIKLSFADKTDEDRIKRIESELGVKWQR